MGATGGHRTRDRHIFNPREIERVIADGWKRVLRSHREGRRGRRPSPDWEHSPQAILALLKDLRTEEQRIRHARWQVATQAINDGVLSPDAVGDVLRASGATVGKQVARWRRHTSEATCPPKRQ